MNIEIYELSAKKINDILKAIRGVKILASPIVIQPQLEFIENAVNGFISVIKGLDEAVKEIEAKSLSQKEFIANQSIENHAFRNVVQKDYAEYELRILKLEEALEEANDQLLDAKNEIGVLESQLEEEKYYQSSEYQEDIANQDRVILKDALL